MKNSVAVLVQTYRERAGLTQSELALQLGVSQQSIAKWESGKSLPRFKAMEKLVDILRIPRNSLDHIQIYRDWAWGPERATAAPEMDAPEHSELTASIESPDSDVFPLLGSRLSRDYAAHFKNFLSPRLKEKGIVGEWGTTARVATMNWQIDFCNENLVVQFIHAKSIEAAVRGPLYARLWRTAALRSMTHDKRYYLVIITLQQDTNPPLRLPEDHPKSMDFQSEIVLRRITAEAPGLGLSLYVARTPSRVVSLLKLPESLDQSDWDSEYDDLEPE